MHYEADFEHFRRVFGRLAELLGTGNLNWNCSSEVRRFYFRPEVGATTPTSGMTSQTIYVSRSISHRILGVGKLKFSGNVQHIRPLIGLEPPGCHGNGSGVMGVRIFGKKMKSRLKKIKKSPIVKNVQNREIGGENNFGGVLFFSPPGDQNRNHIYHKSRKSGIAS